MRGFLPLINNIFSVSHVGFKGNLSLLEICLCFSRGLKQMEDRSPSSALLPVLLEEGSPTKIDCREKE